MRELAIFMTGAFLLGVFVKLLGPSIEQYVGWGPFLIATCTLYVIDRGKALIKSRSKVDQDTETEPDCDKCDKHVA